MSGIATRRVLASRSSRARAPMFVAALAVLTGLAFLAPPAQARQCSSVGVRSGGTARVYIQSGRITCLMAQTVAKEYFARVGGRRDGRTADGAIYYRVRGYRCLTGLAGSEGYCDKRGGRRIFVTVRHD